MENDRHIVKVKHLLKCKNCGALNNNLRSRLFAVTSSEDGVPEPFNLRSIMAESLEHDAYCSCGDDGLHQNYGHFELTGFAVDPDDLPFDSSVEEVLLDIHDYCKKRSRGRIFNMFANDNFVLFKTLEGSDLESYPTYNSALAAWDLNIVKNGEWTSQSWDRCGGKLVREWYCHAVREGQKRGDTPLGPLGDSNWLGYLGELRDQEILLTSWSIDLQGTLGGCHKDSFVAFVTSGGKVVVGFVDADGSYKAKVIGHYSDIQILPLKADIHEHRCLRRWLDRNTH